MKHFDAQNRKNEKGGPDASSGAAGSESKQNKGVRECFGPGIQLFALFPLLGAKAQNIVEESKNH